MQPGNPYHLIEAVGSCQVGSVWSAIDPQGRSLMVALLDPNVATDQRWREAFQEAANALVQAGEPSYLYADFAAGSPWVAYSAEHGIGAERVFLALGMDFQPVPPDGLGPLDHAPFEPTTQETRAAQEAPTTPVPQAPPAAEAPPEQPTAPVTPAQQQPLPPDVIEATTLDEAPPTTAFPPVQPGPPATESAQPVAAQPSPAAPTHPPAAEQPAPPAPAPTHVDAETTQPTQRMELPPAAPQAAPIAPWSGGQPVSPPPQQANPMPPLASGPPYPTSGAPHPISGAPHPTSGAPHPTSGAPHPTSGAPLPTSGAPLPTSGPPQPISGSPMSPPYGQPLSPAYGAPAYGPRPPQGPAPYDPYAPVAPPPRRSRTGLWIGIAVAVLVLIAGGGGVYAWSASGGEPTPPTTSASAKSLPPPEVPTAPPVSPGGEPPTPGKWPANWPRFTERDNVKTLSDLDGLGFTLKVPQDWDCTLAGRAQGFAKYTCGARQGQPEEIGGELIVRDCPQPCDGAQQTSMREAEEAWGVRWIRTGQYTTIGEEILDVNGTQRHALVVVAYWRGGNEGAVDRQLVFRMTAPVKEAQQLRRIATYLRDTLVF